MLCINSRNGQWCWIFQIRLGRKIRTATAPPAKSHGVNKSLRSRVRSSPRSKANAKIAMEYLFSTPRPEIAPKASQSLAFCVWIMQDSVGAAGPKHGFEGVHGELVVDEIGRASCRERVW